MRARPVWKGSRRTTVAGALGILAIAACSSGPDGAPEVINNPAPSHDGPSGRPATGGDETDPGNSPTTVTDGGTVVTQPPPPAVKKKRLTGLDLDTEKRWMVGGTDLGIPYVLENGSIGYLFGDTFSSSPNDGQNWRTPVMLRSAVHPSDPGGIVFDSAAKVAGNGMAPALFPSPHDMSKKPGAEYTVIPNDGISFPETGRQLISFFSVNSWDDKNGADWQTNYASLAYSDNGNDFTRVPNLGWQNNATNTDPFQMWTMQRDGDYVYVFSVRAGRQQGPMMLQRVNWEKMFNKDQYECWNGSSWGGTCASILDGKFGEPSVKKLKSGVWAMVYLNLANLTIVSRTAPSPTGPWSAEKTQVTFQMETNLYGGFIHPWSDVGTNNLHIMVSKFTSTEYHVCQWVGTL
jgi:hypothetical protein